MKTHLVVMLAVALILPAAANAATLMEVTFDNDGATAGQALTSTANTGTTGPASGVGAGTSLTYASRPGGGLCASFGGVDYHDTITFGDESNLFTGLSGGEDYTFSAMIKLNQVSKFEKLFGQYSTALPSGYFEDRTDADDLAITIFYAGRQYVHTFTPDAWTHVVLSMEMGAGQTSADILTNIYIDGVRVGGDPWADVSAFDSADWFQQIGSSNSGRTITGMFDDIRIQNVALDAAGALARYQADIPEPATLGLLVVGGLLTIVRRRRNR